MEIESILEQLNKIDIKETFGIEEVISTHKYVLWLQSEEGQEFVKERNSSKIGQSKYKYSQENYQLQLINSYAKFIGR